MDDREYLAARFCDLASRAWRRDILAHTCFLTLSEQALLSDLQRGISAGERRLDPAPLVMWGGFDGAERKIALFLPSYLTPETCLANERLLSAADESVITCLSCRPVAAKFADELTHRDFLGALMNLGIEREMIGDILIDSQKSEAFVFVMSGMAETIIKELTRVKHTSVRTGRAIYDAGSVKPEFEEREGFISSQRIDVILALVYRLSRTKAQKLIEAEAVSMDGRPVTAAGCDVKPGSRISVRGFGKFIYDGTEGMSRKGKLRAKVRVFK